MLFIVLEICKQKNKIIKSFQIFVSISRLLVGIPDKSGLAGPAHQPVTGPGHLVDVSHELVNPVLSKDLGGGVKEGLSGRLGRGSAAADTQAQLFIIGGLNKNTNKSLTRVQF